MPEILAQVNAKLLYLCDFILFVDVLLHTYDMNNVSIFILELGMLCLPKIHSISDLNKNCKVSKLKELKLKT